MAQHFYPGSESTSDPDVGIQMKTSGKLPIANFVILGHQFLGTMFGSASPRDPFGREIGFTPADLDPNQPRAGVEDAQAGLLPRRCWLTRNATVRAIGCTSSGWARSFASAYLRKGSAIIATTAPFATGCSDRQHDPATGRCISIDQLGFVKDMRSQQFMDGPFTSADAFHKSSNWENIPGQL